MIQTFERQPDGWITRVDLCARCRTKRTDFFVLVKSQRAWRSATATTPTPLASASTASPG